MRRNEKKEFILHELNNENILEEHFLIVGSQSKVNSVAKRIDNSMKSHDGKVPVVFVVDAKKHLLGEVPIVNLFRAAQDTLVVQLIRHVHAVPDHISETLLVKTALQTKADHFVVLDDKECPIGVIHTRDLLDLAVRQAHGKALGLFAGSHQDERADDKPFTVVHLRYKWLILNLATSFLAVSTVSLFESTLSEMVILAAYMPLVAGMGGNAGAQAVAVTVRGIALKEIDTSKALRTILKETVAGLLNGLIIGAIMTPIVFFIGQPLMLGLVLGAALVINLVVAGIFGAGVPLTLKALKFDPALSASIFVTTATDVLGFLAFLGLAGWILL